MKGFIFGVILAVVTGQPQGTQGITQILAGLGFGGVVALFVKAYLDRKKDGAGLSEKAMKAIEDSLDQVTKMREDLNRTIEELARVQQDLHVANVQIEELQRQLVTANGNRARLETELEISVRARDELQAQMTELQLRLSELEATGVQGVPGRKGPRGDKGPPGSR